MENDRKKIIMVDDDRIYLTLARSVLAETYDIFTVASGKTFFSLLEKVMPDLVLLDIEMPEMNGYEIIKTLKNDEKTADIPVIFLSAMIDPESEIEGLDLGAVDYIFKPFSQDLLLKRIELHLLLETQKHELKRYSGSLEGMVFEKTQIVFELQNAILKTVAELVECRDNVTGGHIERTQNYLRLLVEALLKNDVYTSELSSWDIDLFVMSSQLHDVGKISIKDEILLKPGKLTDDEFEEMKKHAAFGKEIIERIESSTAENAFLAHAKILAGSHHEKWDGTGYPLGTAGDLIPLQGRLMAIVDVYDALTNDRPYKKAFSHEDALDIIKSGLGKHFDPHIDDVFIKHENEFADAKITGKPHEYKPKPSAQLNVIFKTISNISDIRDGVEGGHTERIKRCLKIFTDILLKHNDYKEEVAGWDIDIFLMSAQLHDIGKIAVSDIILNKPEKLTEEEFADMKFHTDFGMKIIQKIRENVDAKNLLQHAEILTGSHHEKWDGTGYPKGLKGEEIPLQGRLMAIADVYDALTNRRPHRDMMDHREAVDIIKTLSGKHFDPALIKIFLEHEKEFEKTGAAVL
ncbi:MAG: HD domain-containing protein [Oscillospiraceae bacterium]|nr:HD domain-containing protein [Oscillospiraceae bacterium]